MNTASIPTALTIHDKRALGLATPTASKWPHEATDRVHQLMGDVAAKEIECERLHEELRRLQEGIAKAIAEEREACANEADCWIGFDKSASQACDDIAAAIRSRGASEPTTRIPAFEIVATPEGDKGAST